MGRDAGVEAGMEARLAELAQRYQRKVSLIGQSLGGIYARELARRSPALVRQVITLGSPFANDPKASNAWRLYEALSGREGGRPPARSHEAAAAGAEHGDLYPHRWHCRVAGLPRTAEHDDAEHRG